VREYIQRLAMFLVQGFLTTLAIIDANAALQSFYFEVAEGFSSEVVKGPVGCDVIAAYRTEFLAL